MTAADRIQDFIATEFRVPKTDTRFTKEVHLFEEGYLDSLGVVRLISFLESEFSVQLSEEHLYSEGFTSIDGIAAIVTEVAA